MKWNAKGARPERERIIAPSEGEKGWSRAQARGGGGQ